MLGKRGDDTTRLESFKYEDNTEYPLSCKYFQEVCFGFSLTLLNLWLAGCNLEIYTLH